MPASPALALRGRVRRLGAGVSACALAALAFAPAASGRRPRVHRQRQPCPRTGRDAPRPPRTCRTSTRRRCCRAALVADVCDTTLLHVSGPGTLTRRAHTRRRGHGRRRPVRLSPATRSASSARRSPSPPATDRPRRVHVPAASGSYLVRGRVRSPSARPRSSRGAAALAPRARRRSRTSTIPAGARRSSSATRATARPRSPRWPSARATATCSSRPTACSQTGSVRQPDRDRGLVRPRPRTGTRSAPSRARRPPTRRSRFDADGDALLVTNELPGSVVLRRWTRPTERRDVRRGARGRRPSALAAGATDERPVLARARDATLLACWARTTDLGAYGRQAVLCRHSADGGMTWDAPRAAARRRRSPACRTARTSAASR